MTLMEDEARSKEQEARSKRGKVEKRAAVGDAPPRSRPEEKENVDSKHP